VKIAARAKHNIDCLIALSNATGSRRLKKGSIAKHKLRPHVHGTVKPNPTCLLVTHCTTRTDGKNKAEPKNQPLSQSRRRCRIQGAFHSDTQRKKETHGKQLAKTTSTTTGTLNQETKQIQKHTSNQTSPKLLRYGLFHNNKQRKNSRKTEKMTNSTPPHCP
jgi:hypothetical protein